MINFNKLSLFIHFKLQNTLLTINKGSIIWVEPLAIFLCIYELLASN